MLKRYQILLTDWLADHLRTISEKYDISISEGVRLMLCLQIPKMVSFAYPKYKIETADRKLVTTIKKAGDNEISREDLYKLMSEIYFEARKALEFWTKEEEKHKKVRNSNK
jgi:hypothetical protein